MVSSSTPGPGTKSMALHSEFRRFTLNSHQLKRIYTDTLKALDDISRSGVISRETLIAVETKVKEVQQRRPFVGRPPSVIVLGQNCKVKAILVNELFNKTHLPVIDSEKNESLSWRMVRFKYSKKSQVLLTLGSSYELVENLHEPHWRASRPGIRKVDLTVPAGEATGKVEDCAVVEMWLEHPLLYDNAQVIVPPTGNMDNFKQIIKSLVDSVTPIFLFGISGDQLSDHDISQLNTVRSLASGVPIYFVHLPSPKESSGLTEVERNEFMLHCGLSFTSENEKFYSRTDSSQETSNSAKIKRQLITLGFLESDSSIAQGKSKENFSGRRDSTSSKNSSTRLRDGKYIRIHVRSEFLQYLNEMPILTKLVRAYLQSQLITLSNHLYDIHCNCLQMFILAAFEMTREMQVTPKRLEYAKRKEWELYKSLLEVAEQHQDDMSQLISKAIEERREDILQKAENYQFHDPVLKDFEGPMSGKLLGISMEEIRELVVLDLNNIIEQKLMSSVTCLHGTYLGTLERCVNSLERYLDNGEEGGLASSALSQILTSAYQVEVPSHSSSIFRTLYEKMRQLLLFLSWSPVTCVDSAWRRNVANEMLNSLCQKRLAKAVCSQLREKLKTFHDTFGFALRNLELHHQERLEKTNEIGFRLRKVHAPKLARLALETSSIVDYLKYGMPACGKEVGRGQYGVVYACESWAKYAPCAVKSVVPMDDKHWNDLAMEFYYMRCIPEHDRIVRVRGSVVDHSYAGGSMTAVLIIMDRLSKDLYCAIKQGLSWLQRLQIAQDVVEGIRFLHSQGLVHRDIKLKNILLDNDNRAKLTDLGFCKPEAMMSGSIVGTPIHMAPELFSGQYDNSVDVYAFGILFWYLCSGKTKLPHTFEQCQNKENLWTSVRKGARPEKLQYFDEECWTLMEQCWDGDPSKRPLLGFIEPKLESMKKRFKKTMSCYRTPFDKIERDPSSYCKRQIFDECSDQEFPSYNILSQEDSKDLVSSHSNLTVLEEQTPSETSEND